MDVKIRPSRRAKLNPAYLHSNSTSHVWIFGAIAELIDNSLNSRSASLSGALILQIGKAEIHQQTCLVLTDNGRGMDAEGLHKMMSFGYTETDAENSWKRIGRYGNGFKSGSMRIGDDAIVLTICEESRSVGLLSQTFLKTVRAEEIILPMVTFNKNDETLLDILDKGDLDLITKNSVFESLADVMSEFRDLKEHCGNGTGTRIIIYNLKKGANGITELDFDSDPLDITASEHCHYTNELDAMDQTSFRQMSANNNLTQIPKYRKSLGEYCSILYSTSVSKPGMKIYIRGCFVHSKDVTKRLRRKETMEYANRSTGKSVEITFGFMPPDETDYGMMLYHKNRLIKYEKVGCQTKASGEGEGVVGVVEVGQLLEPVHNKQEFVRSDVYFRSMKAFAEKLNEYWSEKTEVIDPSSSPSECGSSSSTAKRKKESTSGQGSSKRRAYGSAKIKFNFKRKKSDSDPEDDAESLMDDANQNENLAESSTSESSKQVSAVINQLTDVYQKKTDLQGFRSPASHISWEPEENEDEDCDHGNFNMQPGINTANAHLKALRKNVIKLMRLVDPSFLDKTPIGENNLERTDVLVQELTKKLESQKSETFVERIFSWFR